MNVHEAPRWIDVGDATLFGIITRPDGAGNGVGVVVLHGGGEHNLPSHRNRWTVDLARDLAREGFTVLRVAYRGVGESSGEGQTFNLSNPFVGDGGAVIEALASEPRIERIYAVGSCFGARTALSLVPEYGVIAGVVLSALPISDPEKRQAVDKSVADFVKRGLGKKGLGGLFVAGRRDRYLRILKNKAASLVRRGGAKGNPTPWVADSVVRGLRVLAGRGGRALLVYGSDDAFYAHFNEAQAGPLGILAGSPAIDVDGSIPGRLHGYPSVEVQQAFVARASAWLRAAV
ncbi:MAG: alpha/beta fold hydrolase [Acidimicrobiia bacterium]|nr:alpha/beta fold hydrolase [Acidimicrobiia bacterium]